MPTKTLAGTAVELNDEGFFVDADQWTKEMAPEIADERACRRALTDRTGGHRPHAQGVLRQGHRPHRAQDLGKLSDVTTKELFVLFPKGPAKLAARWRASPSRRAASDMMTDTHPIPPAPIAAPIEKVSIIVSKGSLEGIYPALIMANGAAQRGHRGQPVLHLLRHGRRPQGAPRPHQGGDGRQPRPARADDARRAPRRVGADDQLHGEADREARHPRHRRVHRDDPRHRRRPVRVPRLGGAVRAGAPRTTSSIEVSSDIITVGDFYEMAGAGGQIIFT
jgi:dissimilatory sulfite reductase related protein